MICTVELLFWLQFNLGNLEPPIPTSTGATPRFLVTHCLVNTAKVSSQQPEAPATAIVTTTHSGAAGLGEAGRGSHELLTLWSSFLSDCPDGSMGHLTLLLPVS